VSKFEELGVRKDFIRGLEELKIINPTEIQKKVIPILLEKNTDLVGQAQTGTGKTAAFGLPLLQTIDPQFNHIQALILCPTRELGQQVAKQLFKYTKYSEKVFTEAVFGGAPIDQQIAALQRPTHIVVATPGRLIDLIERQALDLSEVTTLVLDEADEMLSMGFKDELDQILNALSSVENKWLFSATIPEGIEQIVKKHLSKDAIHIKVGGKDVVNQKIQHQFLVCDDFIEIIRRFEELRHSRPHLEKMLERRYIQLQQYNGSLAEMRRNQNFTHSQRSELDLTSRMERMMLFSNRKSDVSRLSSLLNASNLSKYINSQRRSHSALARDS